MRAASAVALDHLLAIVKQDRAWNDDAARKQIIQLFDAWGPMDELTVAGRRKLSAMLFRLKPYSGDAEPKPSRGTCAGSTG
jgi:putative thioredoxin